MNYIKLLRLNKPIGILLLWCPIAWALWLANQGVPPVKLLVVFLLGTILMRSAGCVINDIADRHFDRFVTRTSQRPLAQGSISILGAWSALLILLFLAFLLLEFLPTSCFYYALFAVCITFLYPFTKRFFKGPQFILGLAFSAGIPMVYVASNKPITITVFLLILINILWVIAYDTAYALTDKADDERLAINSTAIWWGRWGIAIIGILGAITHALWIVIGLIHALSYLFWISWSLAFGVLIFQWYCIVNKGAYFRAFLLSSVYGIIMWIGLF